MNSLESMPGGAASLQTKPLSFLPLPQGSVSLLESHSNTSRAPGARPRAAMLITVKVAGAGLTQWGSRAALR